MLNPTLPRLDAYTSYQPKVKAEWFCALPNIGRHCVRHFIPEWLLAAIGYLAKFYNRLRALQKKVKISGGQGWVKAVVLLF